jgi:hypothetical protein
MNASRYFKFEFPAACWSEAEIPTFGAAGIGILAFHLLDQAIREQIPWALYGMSGMYHILDNSKTY